MEPKKKVKQNQPKHHAVKNKVAVKARRKKIVKAISEGKTNRQAGIEAGLNPNNADNQVSQILSEPKVKACFAAILDKVIPDERLSNKYSDLLECTKVISANIVSINGEGMKDADSMTRDFIDVPDYATQLRAADSVAKLKGHLKDKEKGDGPQIRDSNVIILPASGTEEEWAKLITDRLLR